MSDKKRLLDVLNPRLKRLKKYKVNSGTEQILSDIELADDCNDINNINNIESIKVGKVSITKDENGHVIANLPSHSGYEVQYNLNTKTHKKVKV